MKKTRRVQVQPPRSNRLPGGFQSGKQMKMNSVSRRCTPSSTWPWARELGFVVALMALAGAGCRKEEIQVYTVPKEQPSPSMAATPGSSGPRPELSWTLPPGWKETGPGQMSVASFSITGSGGKEAQVTITPLARLAGRDAEIVNMWREQVGLEALSREEAAQQFQAIEVGGEPGNLFEIEGALQEGSEPSRIVTAMVHR